MSALHGKSFTQQFNTGSCLSGMSLWNKGGGQNGWAEMKGTKRKWPPLLSGFALTDSGLLLAVRKAQRVTGSQGLRGEFYQRVQRPSPKQEGRGQKNVGEGAMGGAECAGGEGMKWVVLARNVSGSQILMQTLGLLT